jgi:hypothetical protein
MGALLCLFAILAVPASASVNGAGITGSAGNQIDPGLKDALWNIHVEHRLYDFDWHIDAASDAIAALDDYGYDTTDLSGILTTISGKRTTLSDALAARDREALKDVNTDLRMSWKEYRQELRQLLKEA